MTTTELNQMSDAALVEETKRVVELERRSMAQLLALLIEVERRRLPLALGYSSMFTYCTRALHLSEQAAYSRITAARAARRFPSLLTSLADGLLTLSSVGLLAPHLTDDNVEALLESAHHKSTREVERLIASLHPQPDIPASIRALPLQPPRPAEMVGLFGPDRMTPSAAATPVAHTAPTVTPSKPRPIVVPLAPKRYLLKLTIGQETHDKLQRARALLRHAVPDGDPAAVIDRALTLLLKEIERRKLAATSRPKQRTTSSSGRHVPASVRRAVWKRDDGRCTFVGLNGRCDETAFIEQLASDLPSVDCVAASGGVVAMRPLTIHASSKASNGLPRRVLHIEYAARVTLSSGVELAVG